MPFHSSKSQPHPNAEKAHAIWLRRLAGCYNTDETRDEVELIVKEWKEDDCVSTLIHRLGSFCIYTKREFLPQLKDWKKMGCELLDSNIIETTINGKTMYLLVIQPKDLDDAPMCPVAMAFGVLVSGFTYITPDKSFVELVKRVLA